MTEFSYLYRLPAILVIIAVFALLAATAKGGTYSGGTGEPNDPYLIATAEDLNSIGLDPNDWSKSFVLTNDIDLSAYDGNDFAIIGHYDSDYYATKTPFNGDFDGNNHTISNFTYENPDSLDGIGLFGYLGWDANVYDINLKDPNVGVGGCGAATGTLVGYNKGTIRDCDVVGGKVSGCSSVGGVVGINAKDGEILSCSVDVRTQESYSIIVGGICGYNWGIIEGCSASGSIIGGDDCGGIVGDNSGIIENCFSDASVAGSWNIGGIVGLSLGEVIGCVASGNISGEYRVGGLIGRNNYNDKFTVANCYSTGDVRGDICTGGLVGQIFGMYTLRNCYTVSIVDGNDTIGGLIGNLYYPDNTVFEGCIWNSDINPSLEGVGSGVESDPNGIHDFNSIDMQSAATFINAGWDFNTPVWTIDEGNDYPRLWWEVSDSVDPDVNGDGDVNMQDFAGFAAQWLEVGCDEPDWCGSADVDHSGDVGFSDLQAIAENWIGGG